MKTKYIVKEPETEKEDVPVKKPKSYPYQKKKAKRRGVKHVAHRMTPGKSGVKDPKELKKSLKEHISNHTKRMNCKEWWYGVNPSSLSNQSQHSSIQNSFQYNRLSDRLLFTKVQLYAT